MGRRIVKEQSFEKFYFDKVATGEGCGCAERIIDIHEFDRLAGKRKRIMTLKGFSPKAKLKRFLAKAGLTNRPDRPQ
jgi:hypothetical protein